MSKLHFELSWVELPGRAEPVVKHTMAYLQITAGGTTITEVFDRRSRSTDKRILTPIYPLAEWVVANWWTLLGESFAPERGLSVPEFLSRHSLLHARDGFALPDLRILPEGDTVLLQWRRHQMVHQPLEFLADGEMRIPRAEATERLAGLVEAVLGRLSSLGERADWLTDEWRAIQEVQPEEEDFCRAAAWLGLDPFDVPTEIAGSIEAIWRDLSPQLREDVFRATDIVTLGPTVTWVNTGLQAMQGTGKCSSDWTVLRRDVRPSDAQRPWDEGYALAIKCRQAMGLDSQVPIPLGSVAGAVFPLLTAPLPPRSSIHALTSASDLSGPCCYTSKKRHESRRFIGARALGNFLASPGDAVSLLSSAITPHQQFTRAFAAEFLAPAAEIKRRLKSDSVTLDEADELAAEFEVSPWVVAHQIENHGIAQIGDWEGASTKRRPF